MTDMSETVKPQSRGRELWELANEIVKSPIFVFLVGGSFFAFLPQIEEWRLTPAEREARRVETQERADAVLIAPFLPNLSVNEPGRFRASAAALQALEKASESAHAGKIDPMFQGVNSAIDAVSHQLSPQPAVTPEVTKALNAEAVPATQLASSAGLGGLANAVVYLQVDGHDPVPLAKATELRRLLQQKNIFSPTIQKMPSDTIPNKTQVRYFNDADKGSAAALAALVAESTGSPVFTAQPKLEAKEGTLEVWFGRD